MIPGINHGLDPPRVPAVMRASKVDGARYGTEEAYEDSLNESRQTDHTGASAVGWPQAQHGILSCVTQRHWRPIAATVFASGRHNVGRAVEHAPAE